MPTSVEETPSATLRRLAVAWLAATFAIAGCASDIREALRPNFVFILLDDLGYEHVGSYGSPSIRTDTLDALARDGMKFTRFYTSGVVCSPTRASILTGLFPSRLGIKRPFHPSSKRRIPATIPLLPRVLEQAGYVTAHVGKWHLGRRPDAVPQALGFRHSVRRVRGGYYENFDYKIDEGPLVSFRDGEHSTTVLTDHALAFIDRYHDRPFFLNLWYFAPHTPLDVPPGFDNSDTRYDLSTKAGRYAALVTDVDRHIRRIVDRIAELELSNTLLVVTSDNGGTSLIKPPPDRLLRGFKGSVFEGASRVPTIVRWPGVVAPDTENDSVVASIDFLPTLAELAGTEPGGEVDGRSFARILSTNERLTREQVMFWENKISNEYFVSPTDTLERFAVRRGDWKLVSKDDGGLLLFDLSTDPSETNDLSRLRPAELEALRSEYATWRLQAGNVSVPVSLSASGVRRDGKTLRFEGGRADLGEDARLDFHDADFTFSTRFQPLEPKRGGVLAQRGKSWKLVLTAGGAVELTVNGPIPGQQAILSSGADSVASGGQYHVAFTVFGWNRGPSTVRLYLDGELVDEAPDSIPSVRPVDDRIVLGNAEDLGNPFIGRLEPPYMSLNCLSKPEIRAVMASRDGIAVTS